MFAVASRPAAGLKVTPHTPDGVENGEPATGLRAPVLELTENTDTLWTGRDPYTSVVLPAASSRPSGLNETDATPEPAGRPALGSRNGEPATGVSVPILGVTENTDSVPALRFAVASRRPSGLNATDSAPDRGPIENGEPATAVNAPVVGSTENTDTLSAAVMAASRSPLGLKATAPASVPNGEPGTALKDR